MQLSVQLEQLAPLLARTKVLHYPWSDKHDGMVLEREKQEL